MLRNRGPASSGMLEDASTSVLLTLGAVLSSIEPGEAGSFAATGVTTVASVDGEPISSGVLLYADSDLA